MRLAVAVAIGLLCAASAALAGPFGRIEVQAGTGNHVDVIGLGIATSDWFTYPLGEYFLAQSHVLGGVAYWGSLDDRPAVAGIYDFSLTPVLRLETSRPGSSLFVDLGVGIHGLTHTKINDDRTFGSAFQFGEFFGIGVRFGKDRRYEISARVQHISNGGIRSANDGITYGSAVFGYNFH